MATKTPIAVELKPARYYIVVGVLLLLHLVIILFGHLLGGIHIGTFHVWNSNFLLAFLIVYDIASVRFVQNNESAGITVLEREAIETGRGPKFIPPGLTRLDPVPRAMQEDQFPSDPENISKKPDDQELDKTMYKPMRITTGGPEAGSDDSDMLDVRLTLEPTATVIWQIEQNGVFEFLINIDGKTWPEKRAFMLKQMRDVVESQLMIEFKDYTASQILKNLDTINENVHHALSLKMADWGITICSVLIQNLEPDHATNVAMGKVPQARASRIAAIHEAEGEKAAAILKAEGREAAATHDAKARETLLAAEGKGDIAAAQALKMSGADYIASKVAREALGKGDVILGADGLAQLFGLGKHIFQKPKEEA